MILVTVVMMHSDTVTVIDACNSASCRADIKSPASPYKQSANVYARGFQPCRYYRPHHITRLKAEKYLLPLSMTNGKAVLIKATHLPITVSYGPNEQRPDLLDMQRRWGTSAHTYGV